MGNETGAGLKDRLLVWVVSTLGATLIRLLGRTWRISIVGQEEVDKVWGRGKRVLYAFWHGRLLALCYTHRRQGIRVLVSRHRDGEFIAKTIEKLGFGTVRGSSSKGGAKAVIEMVRASQDFDIGISPDGPKGPRHKVQPGAAFLASRAGVPLIPMIASASSAWVLKSWDRFLIPRPFSKVVVLLGEPMWVNSEADETQLEKISMELEDKLSALTERADRYFRQN